MEEEVKWFVVGIVAFFGILIGGFAYSDNLRHVERMECIKAKGEYIKDTCVFR
jgi:hypothetical protein